MRRVGSNGAGHMKAAGLALCATLLAGCSTAPALGPAGPNYVGAVDKAPPAQSKAAPFPRVSSSKVLSAVVFERVTGLEVDPARLIER